MQYESVIGLEVHAQLNTRTKIFCSCSTKFGAKPNSQTCPVCQGHPGVLPVLNKKVLEKSVKAGLAIGGEIARFSKFDRKNYFYPDLPKAYQISQFDLPIVSGGTVTVTEEDGSEKSFGVTRIHMEEDAGKLVHPDDKSDPHSYVDLNRCGTPLIEIVSEPDLRTPQDAYLYLTELKSILEYIEVSDCNMEEGSLRCDANISIRPVGQKELGTKAEIKNMNSFKGVVKALEYEIKRQTEVVQSGKEVVQETRLYDTNKDITVSMRSKEEAHDYRYFPDPDLVPIVLEEKYIKDIKNTLPELPRQKKERLIKEYGITPKDSAALCSNKAVADYYEAAVKSYPAQPKKIANWMQAEVNRILNDKNISIEDFIVKPEHIGDIFRLIDENIISGKIAKQVFEKMAVSGDAPEIIVEKEGLKQVTDTGEIENIIDKIIADNQNQAEQYKAGKTGLLGYFVGQVMKATGGKANPKIVNQLLNKKLSS